MLFSNFFTRRLARLYLSLQFLAVAKEIRTLRKKQGW